MRRNDLFKSNTGNHLRVLLYGEQQSYVVNCQRCKMPFPISTPSLLQMEKLPQDMYRLLALDEDISERQRQQRDRRAELIAPLLVEECICDKSYRNKVLREIISGNSVSRKTVLQYLWLYWVYQSKNALLPAEKSGTEKRPLSSDEKAIRWALNKFYYTPQKQSLQTSYKMMLQAKYCDAKGKLKPDYPSFWQFRYYFRQHRDPISESISREGIKAYQRNHRPFTGAVSDYAGTIGTCNCTLFVVGGLLGDNARAPVVAVGGNVVVVVVHTAPLLADVLVIARRRAACGVLADDVSVGNGLRRSRGCRSSSLCRCFGRIGRFTGLTAFGAGIIFAAGIAVIGARGRAAIIGAALLALAVGGFCCRFRWGGRGRRGRGCSRCCRSGRRFSLRAGRLALTGGRVGCVRRGF